MTFRHAKHPIPAHCAEPDYLSDGAYVSHDGMQVWVSADREGGLHAVALDETALRRLVAYAEKIGLLA